MEGIFVLFNNGSVEGYCECEETIRRIHEERPHYFEIKYVKGKLAKDIIEKYPDLQFIEDEAMSVDEYEYMLLSLSQLPIDIKCKLDRVSEHLLYLKHESVNPLLHLVTSISDKAEENMYSDKYPEEIWNIEKCRKYLFK